MEQLLIRSLLVCGVFAAGACRNKAELERQERRALEESVSRAQDQIHKLNMKELSGEALSEAEAELRRRLSEQAAEDANGGDTPADARADSDGAGN